MAKEKRYLFLVLLIFPLFFLPTFIYVRFQYLEKDPLGDDLVKHYNSHKTPYLLLGDSVIHSSKKCEVEKLSVEDYLQGSIRDPLWTLAKPGLNLKIFPTYLKLFDITRYQPKVVILELNPRSFSDEMYTRPAPSFPVEKIYLNRKIYGFPYFLKHFFTYAHYRYFKKEEKENKRWLKKEVVADQQKLGTVKSILENTLITEDLDCNLISGNQQNNPQVDQKLSLLFRFHYMYDLDQNHPLFSEIQKLKTYLESKKIKLIVFLTPINIEEGRRLLGNDFVRKTQESTEIMKTFFEKNDIAFFNFSSLLPSTRFVDKSRACEHLDSIGRKELANVLVKEISEKVPEVQFRRNF